MKRKRGRPPHADLLTPTEWRTVHFVQHGLSNLEIARQRGISADAVKFHVSNALGKLGLRNRRELRAWFKAPADSALAAQRAKEHEMNISSIGQIARSVSDTAASEKWYREVLGLKHLYTFGTWRSSTSAARG
jgi:DNA-binding CsgD family transcriptional regulator